MWGSMATWPPGMQAGRRCSFQNLNRLGLRFSPSELPHEWDLPRREVEPQPGFTVVACDHAQGSGALTVNLGAHGEPRGRVPTASPNSAPRTQVAGVAEGASAVGLRTREGVGSTGEEAAEDAVYEVVNDDSLGEHHQPVGTVGGKVALPTGVAREGEVDVGCWRGDEARQLL
jgi:hypothetical protein